MEIFIAFEMKFTNFWSAQLAKIGKMDPKWPKNRVFIIFSKHLSLIFPEFGLKRKSILLDKFVLDKSFVNSISSKILVGPKMGKMVPKWPQKKFSQKFYSLLLLNFI